jgi:hypothetical protein
VIEPEPTETPKARVDRELIELLNEIRVALPGVQVLFAFLLVLPFQQAFGNISALARYVYFCGLVASAIATVLLIAPATYHRLNFRRGVAEKEEMLFTSSSLALVGTAFLGVGIGCSLFVVADAMFGSVAAVAAAVATGVLIGGLWYSLPLWRRRPGTGERSP